MTRSLALLSLLALGCQPSPEDDLNPDRTARQVTRANDDIPAVVAGHNAFAWDVYQGLLGQAGDENVFFSPFRLARWRLGVEAALPGR